MKKAIVTGANGFIGSALVHELSQRGVETLAVVRSRESDIANIAELPGVQIVYCDMDHVAELPRAITGRDIDVCIHLAWEGSAGTARTDYSLQMKNAARCVEMVKAAKELGCARILCAGSIMEYEVEAATHAQGSKPGLAYIYGIGKQTAHGLCKATAAAVGIDLIWPMITNAYGPGEVSPRMLNTTIRKIIHGEPLQFTSGTQNYDFVYITDVARAFCLIAERGKPFCEYMIGSGNAKPLKDFLTEMGSALAPETELQFGNIPFTGTNLSLETFSTKALEQDCGYYAEVSFTEGTKKTMEWLSERERNTNHAAV